MKEINNNSEFVLSLDVSTTCIGIALFKDLGNKGKLEFLHHVSPKLKPKPTNKSEEMFKKVDIFEKEFISKYIDFGIKKVIIEEPLLQSNNIYTVAMLLRFNGMIAKSIYDTIGIAPDFISSYDARKYAFEELMALRHFKKNGVRLTEKEISKNKPVLFGGYDFGVDKKTVLWNKVSDLYPQIVWLYDKHNKLKSENYDMSDAVVAGLGYMKKNGIWSENK
jgi:hypothetical protein